MPVIIIGGVVYDYFSNSDLVIDEGFKPDPGTLMVNCPACGIKLKKPRPIFFHQDGTPKCIMQNPNQSR